MVERHAMAWQFHLEVDAARIEPWLIGHAGELAQTQVPTQRLRDDASRHGAALERTLAQVMDRWLERM